MTPVVLGFFHGSLRGRLSAFRSVVVAALFFPVMAQAAAAPQVGPGHVGDTARFTTTALSEGYGPPKSTQNTFSLARTDQTHLALSLNAQAPQSVACRPSGVINEPDIQTARTISRYNDLVAILNAAGGPIVAGRTWQAVIPLAAGVDKIADAKVTVQALAGNGDELVLRAQGSTHSDMAGPVGKVGLAITTDQSFRFVGSNFVGGSGLDTTSASVLFKHVKVSTHWKLLTDSRAAATAVH